MRERNAMQAAYARTKGKRYAETFRCPGGRRAAAPLRQLDLLLAISRRNEELQPPLVRDGELRQPHEGAAPPREPASKRLSQAKNSRYHRREFCGLRIQWFSSGK